MTGQPPSRPPAVAVTKLARVLAAGLSLYAFDGTFIAAPRGWKCDGASGSGGAYVKAYDPRGGIFPSPTAGYEPQAAVYGSVSSSGTNHPLFLACTWFDDALALVRRQGLTCDRSAASPIGEHQTRVSYNEFDFLDPPHVAGTGNPSGGRNPAKGFVLWVPADENGIKLNSAATATCVLPPSKASLCHAVLDDFRARFYREIKKHS